MQIPASALTHGGKFHADDVFSAALLKRLRPDIRILRAFTVPEPFDGLVFDIGAGPFDHHQQGAEVRENGVPYAAFGLLWRAFGASVLDGKEAACFDEAFVQPLDLDDNTGCGNMLADAVAAFNPAWDSGEASDACFEEAVSFAGVILQKKLEQFRSITRARALVEEALRRMEDGIVELPQYAPWKEVLCASEARFVLYPSQRGGFSAQTVPRETGDGKPAGLFPAAWAGRPAQELRRLTGIATLSFCHNSRFLISAAAKEDVREACLLAQTLWEE